MPGIRERSPSPTPKDEAPRKGSKIQRGGRLAGVGWNDVWNEVTSVMDKPSSLHALVRDAFLESGVLAAEHMVNTDRIDNLVRAVQAGYNLTPYHNFTHASHVFLSAMVLLREATVAFTRVEKAALLFTAIIHDLEHQGVPNAQLVMEGSPLASQYSNKSVAENHSLSAAFAILEDPDPTRNCNVFADFTVEEMVQFRHLCTSLILATDIGDKQRLDATYARVADAILTYNSAGEDAAAAAAAAAAGASAGTWYTAAATNGGEDGKGGEETSISCSTSTSTRTEARFLAHLAANRELILILILKLADVGAPMQQYATGIAWAERFYNENRTAHKLGRGPPIEAESFVKGQIGFYDFFMAHLIDVAASIGGVRAAVTNDMSSNLQALKAHWRDKGDVQLQEWGKMWDESV